MAENKTGKGWIGTITAIGLALLFVIGYIAAEGETPNLLLCIKASPVIGFASLFLSAIVRAAIGGAREGETSS